MLATQERAIALKSFLQYLLASGNKRSLAKLLQQHPAYKTNKNKAERTFRSLMRVGTVPTLAGEEFEGVLHAVNEYIATENIEIPSYFQQVARLVGVTSSWSHDEDMLSFINYQELPTIAGTIEQNRELIRIYEGCWRVYRLSSSMRSLDDPRINQAFLNIKPYSVLVRERIGTAEFSLEQRSDIKRGILPAMSFGSNRSYQNLSRIFGIFMQTGDFVTLLGERAQVALGMPYIGILTWPNAAVGRIVRHQREFSGLSLIPNSEGRQIAAYFVASFIDGSEQLSHKDYIELKGKEMTRVGVYTKQDLERRNDDFTLEVMKALIEQSNDKYVLSEV